MNYRPGTAAAHREVHLRDPSFEDFSFEHSSIDAATRAADEDGVPVDDARTSQFGAVARSIAELLAVLTFFGAGIKMIGLESVAGNTVAEAFYNGMGWVSVGVAVTLIAVFLRPR